MGTKRHKPEDVIAKLRQVDVLVGQVEAWMRAEDDLAVARRAVSHGYRPGS